MRSILFAAALLAGCASSPFPDDLATDVMLVPADGFIEFSVDESGQVLDTEFHCAPEDAPPAVRAAMERVVPGGAVTGCEKEYVNGSLYWELRKNVGGRDHEVSFTPDGEVYAQEIEIDPAKAPPTVLQSAAKGVPGGTQTDVEEVRDAAGTVRAYHVKYERDRRRYKVAVTPQGGLLRTVRETTAEIEVPVRL
jgi:hypothetical protein